MTSPRRSARGKAVKAKPCKAWETTYEMMPCPLCKGSGQFPLAVGIRELPPRSRGGRKG